MNTQTLQLVCSPCNATNRVSKDKLKAERNCAIDSERLTRSRDVRRYPMSFIVGSL